jgi:hypothetical protein
MVFLSQYNFQNSNKLMKYDFLDIIKLDIIENEPKNEAIFISIIIKLILNIRLRKIKLEETPLIEKGATDNNHGVFSTKSWN